MLRRMLGIAELIRMVLVFWPRANLVQSYNFQSYNLPHPPPPGWGQ